MDVFLVKYAELLALVTPCEQGNRRKQPVWDLQLNIYYCVQHNSPCYDEWINLAALLIVDPFGSECFPGIYN